MKQALSGQAIREDAGTSIYAGALAFLLLTGCGGHVVPDQASEASDPEAPPGVSGADSPSPPPAERMRSCPNSSAAQPR